jgi:hypothetical protein
VPVLGQQKMRAGVGPPLALIRTLDENGLFEPESTQLVGGQVMGVAGRGNLVTAEDLVDMLVDALAPQLKRLIRDEFERQRKLG